MNWAICAQSTQGTIFGTVRDPSDAAVPQATVTVTSVERGVMRSTQTNQSGEYTFSDMDPGNYVVSVSAAGFKKATNPAVTMTVKARVEVDPRLEIGAASETVQVQDTSPLVRTGSAEVSYVVSRQELGELPVLNRNLGSLTSLGAGTNGGINDYAASISGFELIANGSEAETNNFILDGVSDNMFFNGTVGIIPPIDAVQEFAVQTSQFSAELGHAGGAVVNMALKSGTNQVHGFAYDYFQNSAIDARPYDFTGTHPAQLPLHRNQFGGGAGGPVKKNKIFWFGNYEGLRNPTMSLSQDIVPTVAEKAGDFSHAGFTIYDPSNAQVDPTSGQTIRQPFPGNIIPATRFNTAGAGLLSYYPNPNYTSPTPGVLTNYLADLPNNRTNNSYDGKADFILSQSDTLSAHVSQQFLTLASAGFMLDNFTSTHTSENGVNTGIAYTHIINPHLVNEARVSYNRFAIPALMNNTQNVIDTYHVPGWYTNPIGYGFPTLSIQNITTAQAVREVSAAGPAFNLIENTYQYLDTMTWQTGSHALKFGFEVDHLRVDRYQSRNGGGNFTFNGAYTTQMVGQPVQSPRNGVADMLLGLSSLVDDQPSFDAVRVKNHSLAGFIQDDWRLTHRLTINLGLRWDYGSPFNEEQDRIANFQLSTGTRLVPQGAQIGVQNILGIPGGKLPAGWAYVPNEQVVPHTPWTDFAPRFGIAYKVSQSISLRAGYGLFFDSAVVNSADNAGTVGNPFFFDFNLTGTPQSPVLLSQGIPTGGFYNVLASPAFGAYYSPISRPDPYTEKYTADVEWSPAKDAVIDLGYAGQRGLHFPGITLGNAPLVDGPSPLTSREPYPNVGSGGSTLFYLPLNNNNYNGFTVSFTERNYHGLALKSAYTYSKALGFGTGMDQTQTYYWNLHWDYGLLSYDTTNRWVTSFVYQLPSARSSSGWPHALLSGWETSGVFTLQSGFPFTVNDPGATNNLGGFGGTGNRPNVVGDPYSPAGGQSIYHWFNTSAFQVPTPYTLGNEGKNILRGPGLAQLDMALQRKFTLPWEGSHLTLRMEAANLLNRPQLGNPNASYGVSGFGVIQSLAFGAVPRQLQAVLRFEF